MFPKNFVHILCAALSIALFSPSIFAQSSRSSAGFTLEQVMSGPFPSDLTVQPKGKRIAWAVSARGVRNVWIADAPSFAARQVTHYTDDDGGQMASVRLTST